jgi:hypothetical protein
MSQQFTSPPTRLNLMPWYGNRPWIKRAGFYLGCILDPSTSRYP